MAGEGSFVTTCLSDGVAFAEARFGRFAFSPHSHDAYSFGVTTHGVQAFTFRGAAHASVRGRAFVLHPGERYDGWPGLSDRGSATRSSTSSRA